MKAIVNRKEAIATNSTRYFTGKSCKPAPVAERFTSNRECKECHDIRKENKMKILISYNREFGSLDAFNEYNELVKKVWEINEEAAIKMTEPSEEIFPYFSYSGDLSRCFVWLLTSEGNNYWYNIFGIIEPIDDEE